VLHQSGALQQVTAITSRRDGQVWQLQRRTTCSTPNVIYHILCPCSVPRDYVGSTTDGKRRWSKHKTDCRKGYWDNCGLTKHFQHHHQADMEAAISNLKITLVDHLVGPYREERLLQLEKDWILNLGTFGPTGLNTRNQLLTGQRRNWGRH
jgi:predicted GIY-YIG superfamily endonuclease